MPSPPIPQNAIPLEPMKNGSPPKRRIKDAASAQTIVANLWEANKQRMLKEAAMQAMVDGNPPYNASKMRAAGRSGDANFNTLEAKALHSTSVVPYYDLFAGATHYVDIRTRLGGEQEKARWSGTITEEYDFMLRDWDGLDTQMQEMITEFVGFGRGYLVWDDMKSWRFHKIACSRIMVPDATPIDLERCELVVVLQDWTVAELNGKIRNEKAAKDAGWNISETIDAIESAVPSDPAVPDDPVAAQQQLRDNDLYVSARSSTVPTATLFVREFSGKWSEYLVRRDQIPADSPNNDRPPVSYLFKAEDRYENLRQCINPFFFEVRSGSWNGASGLLRDIFAIMQLKDRIACAQADAVFLRNSLVLQPRTALDKQRMNLMQVGRITWIPDGVEVHQSQILGDITSTIEVSRELTMMTERNTGIYRPTMEKTGGNPETLGEFQMKFAQATVLSVSAVNRFYAQMDRLYQEQFRRSVAKNIRESDGEWAKAALKFRERCQVRGVPPEAYEKDNIESVRAWRNIGNGSVSMRQQALQGFMGIYGVLPAGGQQNLIADIISVNGSQSQVDRYMPPSEIEKLPTDHMAIAMLENAALKIGAPVTWTPSQNNLIHAQTHLQAVAQAAASLQQGADPHEVLAYMDAIGAHVLIHLQRESQNPASKQAVKALGEQWKQLAAVADKLRKHIQATAEQQQAQRQKTDDVLTDQQIKALETQGKLQLSREKAVGTLQLKRERQGAELALKAQAQDVQSALKDAETAAGIMRDNAKAKADADIALAGALSGE